MKINEVLIFQYRYRFGELLIQFFERFCIQYSKSQAYYLLIQICPQSTTEAKRGTDKSFDVLHTISHVYNT
jgi:hypothetical protein